MTNINFENNVVEDENLNIFYVAFITMINVVFQRNNILQNNEEGLGNGGSLRTANAHSRFFQNIIIIDSMSNQKAFGLKFVDDDFEYSQINMNEFGDPQVKRKSIFIIILDYCI